MLVGEIIQERNLMPSKRNIHNFEFLKPETTQVFEDRFPKAWKYLGKHEAKLRGREDGRYHEGNALSHLWYGAARPQDLGHFFRPKLVLQLLSRRNSFAFDKSGDFVFQAGGKGGGVYGIAPGELATNLGALLASLNSNVADFMIKEPSSVYGGRFYSYADQFLKDLPVSEGILDAKSKASRLVSGLAESLTSVSENLGRLGHKIESFPDSFAGDLTRFELDSIGKLCRGKPTSAQISLNLDAISVERTLYGFEVKFGSQQPFEFEHREHAECLAEAIRARDRKTLPVKEVLTWRLPVKPEGSKKLLELLHQARDGWKLAGEKIEADEDQLNDAVYKLYGVTSDERKVIEDFLERYSSHPVGYIPREEEVEGNELPSED
jgi:hypothetical protein